MPDEVTVRVGELAHPHGGFSDLMTEGGLQDGMVCISWLPIQIPTTLTSSSPVLFSN